MSKPQRFETTWGGKPLIIETGRYASQANGSCTVQYADTVVLGTVVMSSYLREGMDFFPLMVDFEERLSAAGRIKGSRFMKRMGRPTDEAVLSGRLIDRGIRPLFDQKMRNDVQVIITVLSYDPAGDPDIAGIIAASCALHISDIPWNGPIAGVRVGQIDGKFIINPSYDEMEKSVIDLGFSGTHEKVLMVEAGAGEAGEETVLEAFWFGMSELKTPLDLIEKAREAVGKEKIAVESLSPEKPEIKAKREEIEAMARPFIREKTKELFFGAPKATKAERREEKAAVKEALIEYLKEKGVEDEHICFGTALVEEEIEAEVARAILEEDKRVDGRGLNEIRQLTCEVAVLPRVHGSSHFKRGETQVMSVATLGSPGDEQTLDSMRIIGKRRYMHHYNFPPFSVGEVKPLRGPGRRDIGHGALAEKALKGMIPDKEIFPYSILVSSETFGSNGSSSMASTCASTLALMDAGVPIKAPIAGIAMGLATNDKGDWKVITDIQDLEDGKGGMDFKITGSEKGITAIQMDTKTHGITKEIITAAITRGREARLEILKQITATIPEPRAELSPYAPRIITIKIDPEKIGDVIGPGGKMINEIIDTTGVQTIDIEEDGMVFITSTDAAAATKAQEWILNLTKEVAPGEIYTGKVTRLMDFGAFVEILPKQEGLVHISAIAPWRIEKVGDIVKVGDEVIVKVIEIDDLGRINLSMKDAPGNKYPEKPEGAVSSSGHNGPHRGGRGGGQRPPRKPFRPKRP